jgi:hypothetical protein
MAVFWDVAPCSPIEAHVSEVLAASIIRAHRPDNGGKHQTTLRNNPEDSHLHTRRREKLKSHLKVFH